MKRERKEEGKNKNSTLPNNDNKQLIHVENYLATLQLCRKKTIISTEEMLKIFINCFRNHHGCLLTMII